MRKAARIRVGDPLVRKLATQILLYYKVPSMDYVSEALAIGDYVKNKVRYVKDPDGIEYLQDPVLMIEDLQRGQASGDCDDMALLIATLLLSVGHTPSFRAVRYRDIAGNFNHIYVVDNPKNKGGPEMRVVLDAIMKDKPIGYEVNSTSGQDFEV